MAISNPTKEATTQYKTSDETVNNSQVLQDDDELSLEVGANDIWEVRLIILSNSTASADLSIGFSMPAAGVFEWIVSGMRSDNSVINESCDTTNTVPIRGHAADALVGVITGIYTGGGTAGTLQFRWCQASAEASDTKVLAGSCIVAHKLN